MHTKDIWGRNIFVLNTWNATRFPVISTAVLNVVMWWRSQWKLKGNTLNFVLSNMQNFLASNVSTDGLAPVMTIIGSGIDTIDFLFIALYWASDICYDACLAAVYQDVSTPE